jgi:hypothetical protein
LVVLDEVTNIAPSPDLDALARPPPAKESSSDHAPKVL